jgi:hypothetical protein
LLLRVKGHRKLFFLVEYVFRFALKHLRYVVEPARVGIGRVTFKSAWSL